MYIVYVWKVFVFAGIAWDDVKCNKREIFIQYMKMDTCGSERIINVCFLYKDYLEKHENYSVSFIFRKRQRKKMYVKKKEIRK